MSNKTQLSNNNTQLASLIQTLQGKATGGGGGGGVETCTITLASGGPPLPNDGDKIIYTDATQTPQRVVHQFGVPYEVVKGSIVMFYGSRFSYPAMSLPTRIELVTEKVYFVTGDATLEIL